jgi:hypothetical protein
MSKLSIPPARDLPTGRLQRRKELLVSEVARLRIAPRLGRSRVALAFATLAALAVGTAFGAYALTRGEPTHVDSIGCYGEASRSADLAVIGNTAGDPVEACAELWRRGDMAPGVTSAPALEACVLATGAVAVVPGTGAEACYALGAAPLSAEGRRELRLLGAVQAALVERLDGRCVGEADARAIAMEELARRGLVGWNVTVGGEFGGERACASPTIDREHRAVVLLPR